MRTLIKKYPINCDKQYKEEMMLEPFPECVQRDIDDFIYNYKYALAENVPDTAVLDQLGNDVRLDVANYNLTEHEEERCGQMTKYYTAVFVMPVEFTAD